MQKLSAPPPPQPPSRAPISRSRLLIIGDDGVADKSVTPAAVAPNDNLDRSLPNMELRGK